MHDEDYIEFTPVGSEMRAQFLALLRCVEDPQGVSIDCDHCRPLADAIATDAKGDGFLLEFVEMLRRSHDVQGVVMDADTCAALVDALAV